MNVHEFKFKFESEFKDNTHLESIYEKINACFNLQFDENLKPYSVNNEKIYDFKDVSNLNPEEINNNINSFFNFNFSEIFNVPLCKFLFLKNNDKLTVLVNIHELYFDYIPLSSLYDLFNNLENFVCENNISHYQQLQNYLKSSDFENDSKYWKKHLSDVGNHVKFYNIKSNNNKNVKIPFNNKALSKFLNKYDASKFDFITAIFSLYLSRIDGTEGCLFKTMIYKKNSDSKSLLKIEYIKNYSFINHLKEVKEVYRLASKHAKVNIDNYINEELSSYAIYDFTNLKNVSILNGNGSALTLNVYGDFLELAYNCDLFSDVYIDHMVENITSLIDNVLNNPNQKCMSIDILSGREKDIISNFCQGKTVDVDKDKTLAMAFRENAVKYPDLIAMDDGVNKITYAELEHSTNSIAYELNNTYGIGIEDCAALMLPRTYHFGELVLALNKIGALFTPIDPNYPLKRIEHMLNISESGYIITTKEYDQNTDLNVKAIYIEDLNMDYEGSVECLGSSDDLFAIMFTSGTTGLPKGAMVSNKQIKGMAAAFKDLFKTSVGDVNGYFASFSFIASIRMFVSFIFGECVRIFNEIEQKDSLLLIKALKEQEMNDLILPPSLGIPIFENEDLKLKYLILAGAKLNELTNKESNTKLVNFYGTTELIMAIVNIYDLNNEKEHVPIGKPVANTWAYILDENGSPLPIGVPGEICISSDYLSPGYYNNIDLTNEVFVDNPNSICKDNERMYRTGDIGFYNFDGEIEIIGREDEQLSVRGFRIESAEILNIMKSFKEINNIYLDVDYDNLIAYYTTNDNLNISDVKEVLKLELPYYMVPSIFIELNEIPLNANGKLDKYSLNHIVKGNNQNIEIDDEILGVVVDAFKEVLNSDFIFIDDDFVELGGTSLSAMKLQMALNEKLGVTLNSLEIMELKTPVNIANQIKFNLEVHSPININYTFDDFCPLSESQLNVYLDESIKNIGTAYNNPFLIKFKKNYSAEEIKNAINKLMDVYPILSARVINDNETLSFSFDAKPQIIDGLKEDIGSFVQPFELDKTLSKFLIVNDESNCLCVDFHHLIFDGSSANIILNELTSILDGKNVDFIDNGVLRQISFEENITSEYMENAYEFFDLMLSDRDEAYELFASVKTEDNSDFEYNDTFNIDNDKLSSFLASHSISPNQFFCSIFAYNLSRFAGSSKILFNLIDDGRGHIDLSESVGMFVRTLPLLIDCKNQDISSFLDYTSALINSAMKYDLYPFRILANQYDLNSNILFQYSHNLFSNLMNNEELDYEIDDLKQEIMGDLSFSIFNIGADRFGIRILYSEKFSKEFIEQFTESYKLILKEIMDSEFLSDITYTLSSDLNILDSYNQTGNDIEYNDILDAFNNNLSEYPNNKLVSYNGFSYSYEECAFIADILAKRLVNLSVNSQEYIPFLVERSELYMFCALGILSAGCVYVPLDDNLPDERIKFMLNDIEARVVIISDGTYERAQNLFDDEIILLNISDIVKGDIETLSHLPVTYGDLACILYTSGTTGLPKGVKITRKGITSYIDFYVNEYDMNNESTFGLFSSIGFDVGAIRAICSPLYCGACLDIVPEDIKLNMDKLNEHFINNDITHTTLPTQIARMFINKVDKTSLKVLITGGEKLGEVTSPTGYSFYDSYGPTECCVAVCAIEVNNKIDSSSIGYLFNNIKAYVLDDEKRRVPIGAVGELCIAGNQVADGYLNRQKETDLSFVKNPFDNEENYSIMYPTGDFVRILPDGSFGIIGRRDSQVKIRGNRVELTEIESIIRNIDYVENVTVQTIDNKGNNEIVAYVTLSQDIDNNDLRELICNYVAKYKPDYMVPSFVIKLDHIPLTVNGKIDKSNLPEVDRSILHVKYVAPRNEKESAIVEAFEKIFNVEKVSIYDDFVRLGGDSLIAIKLLSHLEKYDITTSDILSLRTPLAIANNIDDASLDLDIYSVDGGCPLNEAQVSLFADIIVNDNFNFYQIPAYLSIPKRYGLEKILAALDEILKAHPILNMHLSHHYDTSDNKNLFARINENVNLLKELGSGNNFEDTSIVDLLRDKGWNIKSLYDMIRIILRLFKGEYPYLIKESAPPITVELEFNNDSVKEFIAESLDLYNYLSMFKIWELDDSYLLIGKFHHLIFDALSSNVFKHDFQILLDGGVVDIDDSFLRMSAFNQQVKNTDKFIEAGNFFDSMLSDIEDVGELIGDNQSEGYSMNTYDLEINPEELKSFLDDSGISENVFFTSVFAYTLSKFVKGDKVLFSMVESGRGRFNDYKSIGLYANVVPLLINCENQSIDSFMEHSSNLIYGAIKYSFYPLLLLYQKYPLDTAIIFQYVPNWVNYDGIKEKNSEILSSEIVDDIVNDLVGNIDDLMANLVVQIFQKDDKYSIMFVNSNKYSDKMIKDFNDILTSILLNIIHSDMTSNLNSIFKEENL